jgi:ABC-type transport system substrate-binding protein
MRLLLVLLLVACNVDRGPHFLPRDASTLRFTTKDELRTLDPAIAYDDLSTWITHALYDTLVDYAPGSTQLIPRLAERWEISPDGRRYHFWLRAGIAYADGRPIVAADFKTSLARTLARQDSPFVQYVAAIDHIDVISDRELEITLKQPDATFLYVLAMTFATPLRADYTGDLRTAPLASGPYMLERWDEGQRIVLRKNPHYFDPTRAGVPRIEMLENIPRDTQFLMFEKGEIDAAERLDAADYLWLLEQPAWQPYIHVVPQMNVYGIRMNVRVKPFDDRRVRQALNYALDKQHTVKLLNGAAVPSHGMLPPGMLGRDDSLAPYPHDPAKARALLAEAGYPHGFDVDFVTINDEEAETTAASIQADFAEVGVRVHISILSLPAYMTAIARPDGPPFSLATWAADYPDPTNFLDARFHSRTIGSSNDSYYANPELDALLDAARVETDPARRVAMYHRAERILYDDAPWVWNYHREMTEVDQPYLQNYTPHPVWGRDYTSARLEAVK